MSNDAKTYMTKWEFSLTNTRKKLPKCNENTLIPYTLATVACLGMKKSTMRIVIMQISVQINIYIIAAALN